jgi:hypothetical protein
MQRPAHPPCIARWVFVLGLRPARLLNSQLLLLLLLLRSLDTCTAGMHGHMPAAFVWGAFDRLQQVFHNCF